MPRQTESLDCCFPRLFWDIHWPIPQTEINVVPKVVSLPLFSCFCFIAFLLLYDSTLLDVSSFYLLKALLFYLSGDTHTVP